jgi:hypothetical protein
MIDRLDPFLNGCIAMALCVAGLFFLRFWRDTRDRLFVIFAASFWLLALTRVGLVITQAPTEQQTWLYALRLAAFVLILIAIVDKNLPRRQPPS